MRDLKRIQRIKDLNRLSHKISEKLFFLNKDSEKSLRLSKIADKAFFRNVHLLAIVEYNLTNKKEK
jgi:hypothetical protein